MQIPTGWTAQTWPAFTEGGEPIVSTTCALRHSPEGFTVVVCHETRDTTTVTVYEGHIGPELSYEQTSGRQTDWGMHRSPAAAFKFAEAFLADEGTDFHRAPGRRISERYSRAVDVAYANRPLVRCEHPADEPCIPA